MSKDIRQYLHFYINAVRYRFRYIDTPPGEWTVWVMLTPTRYGRVMEDASVSQIEIEVRKLESMTEDEAKELIGYKKAVEMYENVTIELLQCGVMIRYEIPVQDEGSHVQYHSINYLNGSPQQFNYLLSRGFWLFGNDWFDEGIIIDKSTIK